MFPTKESNIFTLSSIITGTIIRNIRRPMTEPKPIRILAMNDSRHFLNFSPSSRTIVEMKYGEVM